MYPKIYDLGLVDFEIAYQFQQKIFSEVLNNLYKSALITCRHEPAITLGRQAKAGNILAKKEDLSTGGISVHKIERGGDVTYHGPGQLTVYPIFDLASYRKDLHWFLRSLEQAMINLLLDFGIPGERKEGLTGVWVNGRKIGSIGITVRKWITMHGMSLNVKKNDLGAFRLIRPCGMDIEMTSMESVLDRDVDMGQVKESLISKFN